jgi:phosphoglucomutase
VTALEVLAANGVDVMIADGDEYTPTPAVSHAILTYNQTFIPNVTTGTSAWLRPTSVLQARYVKLSAQIDF